MNSKITLGVIIMIALVGAIIGTTMQVSSAVVHTEPWAKADAPVAITGDNIYVAWWTNQSGNEEVMFRASNDKGQTFGDKINLSSTTDADSTTEISDTPVMKVSNDFGKTFGPLLKLAGSGTIASGEVKPVL